MARDEENSSPATGIDGASDSSRGYFAELWPRVLIWRHPGKGGEEFWTGLTILILNP